MKLIINRSQAAKTGLLGGHKGVNFTLRYRLELTPDEEALLDRYKLDHFPLIWREQEGGRVPGITIFDLVQGQVETVEDVTALLRAEEIVKDACDALPPLFEVVRSFGGDEVIEYPRAIDG